jgi:cytochrome c oxidase subunit 2
MWVLVILSGAIVTLVWALIFYFGFKYRAGATADRTNPPKKARWLELGIAFTIFVIGLGIFIRSAQLYYRMYLPNVPTTDVTVVAKQWMWTFHSSAAPDEINELVVPLGRPTRLLMTSEDVIHSFYVPAFRIKQDVLPDRYTSLWFTPTKLGSFPIFCTQYCGLRHSEMTGMIRVVTPEAFAKYSELARLSPGGGTPLNSSPGETLFRTKGCIGCHDSGSKQAPSLMGVFGTWVKLRSGRKVLADDEYLRKSILEPQADLVEGFPLSMPSYHGQMTEVELSDLVAFIRGLKK